MPQFLRRWRVSTLTAVTLTALLLCAGSACANEPNDAAHGSTAGAAGAKTNAQAPNAENSGAGSAAAPTESHVSIVDQPTDESEYLQTQTCVNLNLVKKHEVLDAQHIVFELPHDRFYLNTTRNRCHGMRKNSLLSFTAHGTSLCSLDAVKVLDSSIPVSPRVAVLPEELAGFRVMATCSLGKFEVISKEQVESLRDALNSQSRNGGVPNASPSTAGTETEGSVGKEE